LIAANAKSFEFQIGVYAMKKIALAVFAALVLPTAAFAAEPAATPEKKCCCEKKEHEKGCCDEKKQGHDEHQGHTPASH
jgi:hypothetical protein